MSSTVVVCVLLALIEAIAPPIRMHPNHRGWEMLLVISVLVGLACLSTVLRIAARVKRHTGFGMDDYLCFVASVLMVGMLVELTLCKLLKNSIRSDHSLPGYERSGCTMGGSGYHMSELDASTIILFRQVCTVQCHTRVPRS